MHEHPVAQLSAHAAHFATPQLAMVVASIAAGNTAGQLWVGEQGDTALLWDKGNNVFYLAGAYTAASQRAVAQLVTRELRPRAIEQGLARFKVRSLEQRGWEDALPAIFAPAELTPSDTLFYGYTVAQPPVASAVADVRFVPIDRALLARDDLVGVPDIREEIAWMWPSPDQFYERGLGYAALAGDDVACWCTAEYLSAAMCGIGIATAPQYQNRGIATGAAARFVRDALARGLVPYWECASTNAASRRVAEKVGFTLVETGRYWIGRFA